MAEVTYTNITNILTESSETNKYYLNSSYWEKSNGMYQLMNSYLTNSYKVESDVEIIGFNNNTFDTNDTVEFNANELSIESGYTLTISNAKKFRVTSKITVNGELVSDTLEIV